MHVAALASALKVPVHKLEALEADDYASFSDTVFMRALASSICRSLHLPVQPILDKLPRSTPKGFDGHTHLNAPIKARAGKSGGGMVAGNGGGISRKAIAAVAVLLVGAAAVYFMPWGSSDPGAVTNTVTSTVASTVASSTSAMPNGPAGATPALAPAAAAAAAVDLAPAPAETTPAASAEPAPALSPAASVAEPAAEAAPAAPAGSASSLLVFGASAPSWVQVKDARGTVVLQKNLTVGESVPVSGALPLSVVIGRADATTLQVRGQAFDLAPVTRDNVARFEVK